MKGTTESRASSAGGLQTSNTGNINVPGGRFESGAEARGISGTGGHGYQGKTGRLTEERAVQAIGYTPTVEPELLARSATVVPLVDAASRQDPSLITGGTVSGTATAGGPRTETPGTSAGGTVSGTATAGGPRTETPGTSVEGRKGAGVRNTLGNSAGQVRDGDSASWGVEISPDAG